MRTGTLTLVVAALCVTGAAASAQTLPGTGDPLPDVEETAEKTVKKTVDGATKAVGAATGGTVDESSGSAPVGSGGDGSGAGPSTPSTSPTAGGGGSGGSDTDSRRETSSGGSSAATGLPVAGDHDKCPPEGAGDGASLLAAVGNRSGGSGDTGHGPGRGEAGGTLGAGTDEPGARSAQAEAAFPGIAADSGRPGPILTALVLALLLGTAVVALAGGIASGLGRLRSR